MDFEKSTDKVILAHRSVICSIIYLRRYIYVHSILKYSHSDKKSSLFFIYIVKKTKF